MQQGMPLGMCNIGKKMNWYVKKCQTRPDDRMIATKNNSIQQGASHQKLNAVQSSEEARSYATVAEVS